MRHFKQGDRVTYTGRMTPRNIGRAGRISRDTYLVDSNDVVWDGGEFERGILSQNLTKVSDSAARVRYPRPNEPKNIEDVWVKGNRISFTVTAQSYTDDAWRIGCKRPLKNDIKNSVVEQIPSAVRGDTILTIHAEIVAILDTDDCDCSDCTSGDDSYRCGIAFPGGTINKYEAEEFFTEVRLLSTSAPS